MKKTIQGLLFGGALAAVAGCGTTVFETEQVSASNGLACQSTMGGYYLPKSLVHLKVVRAPPATGQRGFIVETGSLTQDWVADQRQLYCLDYLASANSIDKIKVQRDQRGLLWLVESNVEDRSVAIADTLIKTATEVAKLALRSGTLETAPGETLDIQFDPFNPFEMKRINASLRRFGLCVYVEGHSFNEKVVPAERWCSDPHQDAYVNPFNKALAMSPVLPEAAASGILYRPNKTHNIVVRRKADPGGREPWALYMSRRMEMPNVSPILQVGVQRALFAQRDTTLNFINGVLTNVKVDKKSELEQFVQIPLKIASAIVALPAEIIQIRIIDIKGEADLLVAQAQLIEAMKSYQDTVSPPRSAPVRTVVSELVQNCLDGGHASCAAIGGQ